MNKLFDRFDHAVLSMFTMEKLAHPFTVNHTTRGWEVYSMYTLVGIVKDRGGFWEADVANYDFTKGVSNG